MKEPFPLFHVHHMGLDSFERSAWVLEQMQSYFWNEWSTLLHVLEHLWARIFAHKASTCSSGFVKLCSHIKGGQRPAAQWSGRL